jgi:hypothetical protein
MNYCTACGTEKDLKEVEKYNGQKWVYEEYCPKCLVLVPIEEKRPPVIMELLVKINALTAENELLKREIKKGKTNEVDAKQSGY